MRACAQTEELEQRAKTSGPERKERGIKTGNETTHSANSRYQNVLYSTQIIIAFRIHMLACNTNSESEKSSSITHQSSLRESVNALSLRGPLMASRCLSSANRERDGIEGCSQ